MTSTELAIADPVQVWADLLAWYRACGRDLPWRHTTDPYAILVSEIMLQQTQVDRVLPKYQAFLAAFPTFADLATATTADVLRAWAPLGYNQRAVRLQRIAQVVIAEHGGAIPSTIAGLLRLPGVGRYTAGAIACFALGQRVATVDTNIQRVLTRIFIGDLAPQAADLARPATALALAETVLPPTAAAAYDWNQALMDLGATRCLARAPLCERCPVAAHCQTFAQLRQQTLFPVGAALPELRRVAEAQTPYQSTDRLPAERPSPKARRTEPFKSSNRYFRGRILAALRDQPEGAALALADLGLAIKPAFTPDDLPWLHGVVAGMVRDGLAAWRDEAAGQLALP